MNGRLDLDAINGADPAVFVAAVAPLFEGAPGFLDRLARDRPFDDWPALFTRARAIAHTMQVIEQIELIDAHPRLGAPPATVSTLSFHEQGYDRDGPTGRAPVEARAAAGESNVERDRVVAELARLNAAYESRFAFRYCVHVAGRTRAELLPEMEAALDRAPDAERHRALDAVMDIAMDRLAAIPGLTR